ncbi:MAG: alkaline phosphatase family protein [Chlorobi bacterium]|nr:alkaline phosphatase family protein [Chlorobiota bacterium]
MKYSRLIIFIVAILAAQSSFSQASLISSGPMPGYSGMKEVAIWLQTTKQARVFIRYHRQGTKDVHITNTLTTNKDDAFTAMFIADTLEPGNIYEYEVYVNGKKEEFGFETRFKTQKLWKWRSDAPDFSFLMGSGAYINETRYDRPGKPYGGDYKIYNAMAKSGADFMLWLGDNVYLREADWNSWTGIVHRYTQARQTPELRKFIASMHNYAILDDHDFGPNDSDRSFWNRNQTLKAFELFWANPSYGVGDIKGAITSFEYADCEFYLLDNRSYRNPNKRIEDNKTELGEDQLQWLFDNLSSTYAQFKFVVMGGQLLSTSREYESYSNHGFAGERQRIIDFIQQNNIKNVVFLTGDVHFSEVSVLKQEGKPTIWDITSSPLNSGANTHASSQKNELRIPGSVIMQRNYTEIKVVGDKEQRHLEINYFDVDGKKLYSIELKPEKYEKKK